MSLRSVLFCLLAVLAELGPWAALLAYVRWYQSQRVELETGMSGSLTKADYPPSWIQLRMQVLARAQHCCECQGECANNHGRDESPQGICGAPQHVMIIRDPGWRARWWLEEDAPTTLLTPEERKAVRVVLTIAHLCQDSTCGDVEHLRSMCQFCHLHVDMRQHVRNAAATRRKEKERGGQVPFGFMR